MMMVELTDVEKIGLIACYLAIGLLWATAADWDEYYKTPQSLFSTVSIHWFGFLSKTFVWPFVAICYGMAVILVIVAKLLVFSKCLVFSKHSNRPATQYGNKER